MVCGKSDRNVSFNQFYIFGCFNSLPPSKLLVIFFTIKMYARNNIFEFKITFDKVSLKLAIDVCPILAICPFDKSLVFP